MSEFLRRRIASTSTPTIDNIGVGEPVEEIVIDRVDDVVKSVNDNYDYR